MTLLCFSDGTDCFPLVMVGGVLEANKSWDIGKEVIRCISKDYPHVYPIRPTVKRGDMTHFIYTVLLLLLHLYIYIFCCSSG